MHEMAGRLDMLLATYEAGRQAGRQADSGWAARKKTGSSAW